MSEALVADAVALINERGTIRSSAIAELLECTVANVHELLRPRVEDGELIACDVEAGGEKLKDYRPSTAGGGMVRPAFTPYKSSPAQKKPPTPVRDTAPQSDQPKEDKTVNTLIDKITAALKKHGPMTSRQMKAHVKCSYLAVALNQLANRGVLGRLGGGKRSTIFGLPDQEAPAADGVDIDRVPPHLHKKRGKKKAATSTKRAGGGGRMPRKPRKSTLVRQAIRSLDQFAARRRAEAAPQIAGSFRPAITCDGALLLVGQHQAGELNNAETRVLADFLARVDRTGVRT